MWESGTGPNETGDAPLSPVPNSLHHRPREGRPRDLGRRPLRSVPRGEATGNRRSPAEGRRPVRGPIPQEPRRPLHAVRPGERPDATSRRRNPHTNKGLLSFLEPLTGKGRNRSAQAAGRRRAPAVNGREPVAQASRRSTGRRLELVMPPGNPIGGKWEDTLSHTVGRTLNRLGNRSQQRSRSAREPKSYYPTAIPQGPKTRSGLAVLYGTRLLIFGVGVGVLAGTILSVFDPAKITTAASPSSKPEQVAVSPSPTPAPALELSQEIAPLKTQIQAAIAPLTQLTPSVMLVDLESNAYVDINATTAVSAASTIKFPVLVAFFQDVDAGKVRLDEMLAMRQDLIATESGDLQYQPPGSQFLALEVATKMMTISDNTATNMIIDRLGGKEALNQRFQSWGLTNTQLQNPLPDLPGTNMTSPKDMVTLLSMVNSGQMVSRRSNERLLDIMRNVVTDSLLPKGLGPGATIAHKTGDIGSMVGDVGLIDMPTGKRYLMAILVKRPHNDDRAQNLIRQISTMTYQHFEKSAAPAQTNPANLGQPNSGQPDSGQPDSGQPDSGQIVPTNPAISPVRPSNGPSNGPIDSPGNAPGNSQGAAPIRSRTAQADEP